MGLWLAFVLGSVFGAAVTWLLNRPRVVRRQSWELTFYGLPESAGERERFASEVIRTLERRSYASSGISRLPNDGGG